MICASCHEPLPPDARFCPKCGTSVAPAAAQTLWPYAQVRDRGALIVALGVLAILIFGPFTGVPGWLIANSDMRDIRAGLIPLSARSTVRTGRVLNIVGTFCSLISLLLFFILGVMAFVFIEMGIAGTSALCSIR